MKFLLTTFLIFISFGFSIQPRNSGIKIYTIKEGFTNSFKDCRYCFDEKLVSLSEKPIFDENDIESFNWKDQQIFLNESGKMKLKKNEIKLSGLPAVMVLNDKIVYGFWFWNNFSSFGCDRVYTYPNIDFKIKFGLPEMNKFGEDPRFNKVLEKYVKSRYKQN
ncbi:hypothetical protein [Flavobacterium defluvii]|uniref:Uncharacterized protein n=1 Tax=Flavobacterium defluvii TaxID=370979 RepID=A0A1M5W8B0_9FLAO|nr:hypothetical protein [Flavobacterium defluvii]SHH83424.1 hypothetical protein SAMN05443663_1139 [Flavobacterium defluvii]